MKCVKGKPLSERIGKYFATIYQLADITVNNDKYSAGSELRFRYAGVIFFTL